VPRAKRHPQDKPRGVRASGPRSCKMQAKGGSLVWVRTVPGVRGLETPTPEFWSDRPAKFPGHIRMLLRKPGTVMTDIKWRQAGSQTWWRLPDFPDGNAGTEVV
jgi:hypothetical protein